MSLVKFNELKNKAKSLGIDVKGMKAPEIEEAIARVEDAENNPIPDEALVQEEVVETIQEETTEAKAEEQPVVETKRLGRPIVPGSERQKRLAERAERAANGGIKRGRPVVEDSARQKRLAMRMEKIANGIEIKPGRPKMVKDVVVEIQPTASVPAEQVTETAVV